MRRRTIKASGLVGLRKSLKGLSVVGQYCLTQKHQGLPVNVLSFLHGLLGQQVRDTKTRGYFLDGVIQINFGT